MAVPLGSNFRLPFVDPSLVSCLGGDYSAVPPLAGGAARSGVSGVSGKGRCSLNWRGFLQIMSRGFTLGLNRRGTFGLRTAPSSKIWGQSATNFLNGVFSRILTTRSHPCGVWTTRWKVEWWIGRWEAGVGPSWDRDASANLFGFVLLFGNHRVVSRMAANCRRP